MLSPEAATRVLTYAEFELRPIYERSRGMMWMVLGLGSTEAAVTYAADTLDAEATRCGDDTVRVILQRAVAALREEEVASC